MDNENSNNTRKGTVYSRDQKRVDKEYYEGLYNDLPKEVVNILMETHPLMGQNEEDPEATAYRTRRPEQSEVDAVKASRMQQIGKELAEEMDVMPDEEYVPRSSRNTDMNRGVSRNTFDTPSMASSQNDSDLEEEDDKIQYVQMKVTQRRPLEQGEGEPKKKKKNKQSSDQLGFGSANVENQKYNFQDFDWSAKEKEDNLNQLYDDDFEDKERMQLPGKKVMIAGVVAILLIGVFGFTTLLLKNKLAKAEEQLQAQTDLSAKYEELQLQKLGLEDEIKTLKGIETPTDGTPEGAEGTIAPSEDGSYEIYTALQTDTYWSMAAKFYGNGAEFPKILEANGLTEADSVQPGQKYKIPKKE